MSWPAFLTSCGAVLLFLLLVDLRGRFDERRWKRQRETEEAARWAAE